VEQEFQQIAEGCSGAWLPTQDDPPPGYVNASYSITTASGKLLQAGSTSFLNSDGQVKTALTFEGIALTQQNFDSGEAILVKVELPQQCSSCAEGADPNFLEGTFSPRFVNPWLTILPPLVTLIMAVLTQNVVIALAAGIWVGAILMNNFNPFVGFLRVFDTYIVNSIADPSHASVIVFSQYLGGLVALIQFSGGAQGMAMAIGSMAKNSYSASIIAWGMGLIIFFDDYSNCLIVGNSFRPVSDHMRISREKLAFLVDCTAAPIATTSSGFTL